MTASTEHKSNLDILRSLAVCCVLVHHLLLTLHAHLGLFDEAQRHFLVTIGHAGVLAFFVHTSLVLMYSLQRMHSTGGQVTLPFYLRRAFRIYPLAIAAIVVALLFHVPGKTWDHPVPVTTAGVVANLFLVQNLFTKQQVLGPLWSLPYEVQMYVVLPGLFLLARGKKALLTLGTLLVLFCALGFGVERWTHHLNMAAYVPCFLAGVLCYSLRGRLRRRIPSSLWIPFLLTLIAAFLFVNRHEEEPTFWTGWIFCLLLAASINLFRESRSPAINVTAEKLALYSYGIYLLHPLFLYLVFVYLGVQQAAWGTALFLLLTLAASTAGFHIIESPMMGLGRRLSESRHLWHRSQPVPTPPPPSLRVTSIPEPHPVAAGASQG